MKNSLNLTSCGSMPTASTSRKLPSSEWRFHLAAYQTRPDAQAVVHNHAVHCTAVSILNRPIPAIHYMIAAPEELHSLCAVCHLGTRELSEFVAVALKHRKATLLQHHGLIACEENLEKRCGWRMKSRFWLNSISVPRRSSILYRCWTTRPLPSYWKIQNLRVTYRRVIRKASGRRRWRTE